jgi:uncharacterized protein YqeY
MLFIDLQKRKIDALRNKENKVKDILDVVLSESIKKAMLDVKNIRKEPTDDEIINVIEKQIKANEETIKLAGSDLSRQQLVRDLTEEVNILKEYIPKKLTSSELENAIDKIIALIPDNEKAKAMGKVMAALKQKFGGKYDGNEASKLVKVKLS